MKRTRTNENPALASGSPGGLEIGTTPDKGQWKTRPPSTKANRENIREILRQLLVNRDTIGFNCRVSILIDHPTRSIAIYPP